MIKKTVLANLKTNAAFNILPNIRTYNRLEVSPRTDDLEQSVKMQVADPLWYLCRQWQFGEFQAEDAATAYQANILGFHSKPSDIILNNGNRIPYDLELPLETAIEREAVDRTFHLSAQMGNHFNRLLKAKKIKKYIPLITEKFPLNTPNDEGDLEGSYFAKALVGFQCDGYKVYQAVLNFEFKNWYEQEATITNNHFDELEAAGNELVNWFHTLYEQPLEGEQAWQSENLEYNFKLESKISSSKKRVLLADQYASGHLDWKDFDQMEVNSRAGMDGLEDPEKVVQTFIPSLLKYSGMPHPRLWQMEDSLTDFGKIDASSTSIMNLLLAEYGLNYSNDWFVLPYEMQLNTLCEIKGICVTDVFGLNFHIQPTIEDPEMNWQEFAFFHQTERDNATQNESMFYMVPAVGKMQESEDIEKVNFIRDEMSNLVWAIEQVVPSAAGKGRLTKQVTPSLADFEPADDESKIRYVLGNTVPKNWIPFIPVHKKNANPNGFKEIKLQRARMPQGAVPISKLLKEEQPVFFVEEKEIPRSGIIVKRNFQRTRWLNGKTLLWIGRKKTTGRGEGSANLMFDQLLTIRTSD